MPPLSSPVVMGMRGNDLHHRSVEQLPSGEVEERLPTMQTHRERREDQDNPMAHFETQLSIHAVFC